MFSFIVIYDYFPQLRSSLLITLNVFFYYYYFTNVSVVCEGRYFVEMIEVKIFGYFIGLFFIFTRKQF